jgi:hypothetical protein
VEPDRIRRPDRKSRGSARPTGRARRCGLLGLVLAAGVSSQAQIDPQLRRLFQIGYSLPLHEHGPIAAYGYYYHNQPGFLRTNLTLRLALAPIYLDGELGIRQALGPATDLGLGLAGGGYADSYAEIREGNYLTAESFTGHGLEGGLSLYHRFNPAQTVPLNGIVRAMVDQAFYVRDDETAPTFVLPDDRAELKVRTGLRLGGREPYLNPALAGEVSVWYEGEFRSHNGPYGYDGDRTVAAQSHRFWARGLLAYTVPESQQYLEVAFTAGTSVNADRFSAYRLGGSLPLVAEFPLMLPGYHLQEISASEFLLFNLSTIVPLEPSRRWALGVYGAAAVVDYLPGLEQPSGWNSGLGAGLVYRSRSAAWQVGLGYGYGVDAIREEERGAHTFTVLVQYDLDAELRAGGKPFWNPLLNPNAWGGLIRIFGGH